MRDAIVFLLMKCHCLRIVKDTEEVSLDGVRIRGLSKNLQEGRIRNKEEPREDESLFLKVASERFLTEFQLLQQMREKLPECLITNTADHNIRILMSFGHDLHP